MSNLIIPLNTLQWDSMGNYRFFPSLYNTANIVFARPRWEGVDTATGLLQRSEGRYLEEMRDKIPFHGPYARSSTGWGQFQRVDHTNVRQGFVVYSALEGGEITEATPQDRISLLDGAGEAWDWFVNSFIDPQDGVSLRQKIHLLYRALSEDWQTAITLDVGGNVSYLYVEESTLDIEEIIAEAGSR
jgi:hypothetical protein